MTSGRVARALAHHWLFIVLLTLTVAAVAAVVGARSPDKYRASALLQVQAPIDSGGISLNDTLTARERAVTITALANTYDVLRTVFTKLPGNRSDCSASQSGQSEFLYTTCSGTSATAVSAAANEYARELQDYLESQRAARTQELARQYRVQIAALKKAGVPPQNYPTPPVYPNYRELEIIDAARTPGAPYAPRPLRVAAIALVLALLMNAGLAVLIERLQNRARTLAELEQELGEPILAPIPHLGRHRGFRVQRASAPARSPRAQRPSDAKEHA